MKHTTSTMTAIAVGAVAVALLPAVGSADTVGPPDGSAARAVPPHPTTAAVPEEGAPRTGVRLRKSGIVVPFGSAQARPADPATLKAGAPGVPPAGFDWRTASIGAASGAGLIFLLAGCVVFLGGRREQGSVALR
jgi:hypothetical protein